MYSRCGHIVYKGRNSVNENEEDANEGTQEAENDNERRRFRLPGRGLSSDFSLPAKECVATVISIARSDTVTTAATSLVAPVACPARFNRHNVVM